MTKYYLRWGTLTLLTLFSLFGHMNGDFGLISVPVGIGAATLGGSAIYYGVKVRGSKGSYVRACVRAHAKLDKRLSMRGITL